MFPPGTSISTNPNSTQISIPSLDIRRYHYLFWLSYWNWLNSMLVSGRFISYGRYWCSRCIFPLWTLSSHGSLFREPKVITVRCSSTLLFFYRCYLLIFWSWIIAIYNGIYLFTLMRNQWSNLLKSWRVCVPLDQ